MKKACLLILSAFVTIEILSGCEIDVNKMVSSNAEGDSSSTAFYESSASEEFSDTDTDVDVPDTDTQTDTEEQQNEPSFDTSAYKTMFVSGAASVELVEDAKGSGSIVGMLNCGEGVSFIKSVTATGSEDSVSFVYSETLGNFGYIKNSNLVDLYDEVSIGEIYYISSDFTPFYSDQYGTNIIKNLSKNDMVTVLAKLSSGIWRVSSKSGTVGYVGSSLLSEEKIEKKSSSSKAESSTSSKTTSSKTESVAESSVESSVESHEESRVESVTESKVESKKEPSVYIGEGAPPVSGYTVYIVDVDIDYLALRSEESSDPDSIIGQLYYGEYVDVIDANGTYWYVYAPSCGKYGFVRGDSDYLIYADY